MPQVNVIELMRGESSTHGTGDHVWVEIEFSGGRKVTLRVDEFNLIGVRRPRLYHAVDAEIGKEVML